MDEDLDNGEVQQPEPSTTTEQTNEPKSALEALEGAIEFEGKEAPATTEAEPTKPVDAAKPAEPADDLYKMPEGLQPKSQERFRALVEQNQQKDTELTQVRQANDWITKNLLTDEQAADDLVGFSEYRNALKSGNYEAAGKLLQAQVQQFVLASGQQLQTSPLSEFPDLQQRVDGFELDEADALEIARYRQQQAIAQGQQQSQAQSQQQQEQFTQAVNSAVQNVETMVTGWKKSDIDYQAKEKIIQEKLPEMMRQFHPSQIPAQVKMLYEALSAVSPQRANQSQSPLRATGRGAGNAVPKTSLEAMDLALGYGA